MTRTETLAAIAALPATDAVKQHATRLVEGLPEWCPMPDTVVRLDDWGWEACCLGWRRDELRLEIQAAYDSDFHYNYVAFLCDKSWSKAFITIEQVHELLRQLTGMVALTGGG